MDPQETLEQILANLNRDEPYKEILAEDLRSLADWIEKNGFVPSLKEALKAIKYENND